MDKKISFNNVSHTYNANTPFEFNAIRNMTFDIPLNKVTAIIGHTGSGKSTLLQHLNVLIRPTTGTVNILGEEVSRESDHGSLKKLRKQVGVVFQFPEAQLFEETVLKDVMFGPMNFGANEEEATRIAREKLMLVGINESLFDRSPFDLSGGQMRRVAIAGVLALEPEVLVLDEPTAGLDPAGHQAIMKMFMDLKEREELTLVLVSHQMDDVARYADHIIVLEGGTVARVGSPQDIFSDSHWLGERQLGIPSSISVVERLNDARLISNDLPLTVESLADRLAQYLPTIEGGFNDV